MKCLHQPPPFRTRGSLLKRLQWEQRIPRKQCVPSSHSRTSAYVNSETVAAATGPAQVQAQGSHSWEGKGHKLPSLTKKLFPMDNGAKEKKNIFFNGVSLAFLEVCVCLIFLFFFFNLTCLLLIYYGFWFCVLWVFCMYVYFCICVHTCACICVSIYVCASHFLSLVFLFIF